MTRIRRSQLTVSLAEHKDWKQGDTASMAEVMSIPEAQ